MPLHTTNQRTIYNGNSFKERFRSAQPPLGNSSISRHQNNISKRNYSEGDEDNPFKQIRRRKDESLLRISSICHGQAEVLFQTKTFFPFDFFPDILTITATKIEIKIYSFFFTYSTITIPLQDIGFVELDKSLFFASLSVINIRRSESPVTLNFLLTKDAVRCRRIINGLLIAQEAGVDVSIVEPKNLLPQIEGLGE